jgi:hypothetical protein
VGGFEIPQDLWDTYVPGNFAAVMEEKTPPIGSTSTLTATMLTKLTEQGLLIPTEGAPNLHPFLIPKNKIKCSIIMHTKHANSILPKPPPFHLVSWESLDADLSRLPRDQEFYASHVDVSNAFWSFKLPRKLRRSFRMKGAGGVILAMTSLPFGWSYSPILCQKVFEHIAKGVVPGHLFLYVYIDDFLIVGRDREEVRRATRLLVEELTRLGFLVSPKSTLDPTHALKFLGKHLDFRIRTIQATPFSAAQLIFRWVRMATGHTGRKFLRSFFGLLIWLARPHKGMACFYGGAYGHLLWGATNRAFTPRGTLDALASGIFFALKPYTPPIRFYRPDPILSSPPSPDVLDLPMLLVDGGPDGRCPGGGYNWRAGLFSPDLGTRTQLVGPSGKNQQVIELLALIYAIKLAIHRGWPFVVLGSDSEVALAQVLRLRAGIGLKLQQRLLRGLVGLLTKSPVTLLLVWVPSELQPADPLSRIDVMCRGSREEATSRARDTWGKLQVRWEDTRFIGQLSLFTG